MSNVLKVTTPISGYDKGNSVRVQGDKINDKSVKAPIIPDKVVKTDVRDNAGAEKGLQSNFKYKTNFDNFVQQLRKEAALSEDFLKIFFGAGETVVTSGIDGNMAEEISKFMEFANLKPEELVAFLKSTTEGSVKYKGVFFDLLRQSFMENGSLEVRLAILDFLKKSTDMAEGQHLLREIEIVLSKVKKNLFSNFANELNKMEGELNYGEKNGVTNHNAEIIKEKILPFLNSYIKGNRDRGAVRENTALLSLLVARYENGNEGNVKTAFERLSFLPQFAELRKSEDPELVFKILQHTDYEKSASDNMVMKKMAQLIKSGVLKGGQNYQSDFSNMMRSMLLNESVYMPVLHMALPLNVNGKLMYSEMWIDPDSEQDRKKGEKGSDRKVRGLVKFDIKNLGFFDLFFIYSTGAEKNISLQFHYPESMAEDHVKLSSAIREILGRNQIQVSQLVLDTSEISIPVSEAFPVIAERRDSINVRI